MLVKLSNGKKITVFNTLENLLIILKMEGIKLPEEEVPKIYFNVCSQFFVDGARICFLMSEETWMNRVIPA